MTHRSKKVINYSVYAGSGDDSDFDTAPIKTKTKDKKKRKINHSSEDTDFADDIDDKFKMVNSKDNAKKKDAKNKEAKPSKKIKEDIIIKQNEKVKDFAELESNKCDNVSKNDSLIPPLILKIRNVNNEVCSLKSEIYSTKLSEKPIITNAQCIDVVKDAKRNHVPIEKSKDERDDERKDFKEKKNVKLDADIFTERPMVKLQAVKNETISRTLNTPKLESTKNTRSSDILNVPSIVQNKFVTSNLRMGLSRKQRISAPLHFSLQK